MHFGHLALEIHLHIIRFCSHSDLCSLARVHSSLRVTAEHVLYSHIYFCAWPFDLIQDQTWKSWKLKEDRSLLHTLASNTRKAAMVRVLWIDFENVGLYNSKETLHSILLKLSEALPKMSNLVDLRVVYDDMLVDPSDGAFGRAIRFVCSAIVKTVFIGIKSGLAQGQSPQTRHAIPRTHPWSRRNYCGPASSTAPRNLLWFCPTVSFDQLHHPIVSKHGISPSHYAKYLYVRLFSTLCYVP